jgi:hypothetical protein
VIAHRWGDVIAATIASIDVEGWTTAEAGGTTALVVTLCDDRVVAVTASEGPFELYGADDHEGLVEVDGFLIDIWPDWDARMNAETPTREVETGPELTQLTSGVAAVLG